jgi:hypothetical protein
MELHKAEDKAIALMTAPVPHSFPSTTKSARARKRPRDEMTEPPKLNGELYRVLLAHKSLGAPPSPDWGDIDRLAVIGRRVLPLVATDIFSKTRPILEAVQLEVSVAFAECVVG